LEFVLRPDEPALGQIIEHVVRMVALGFYRPGDALPSALVLGEQIGVSRTIVQQAFRSLEQSGITSAVRGGVTSIAEGADTRRLFIRRMFSDVIDAARNLIPPLDRDEVDEAYRLEAERHFRTRRRPTEDDSS
jgi:DNA-binding transcriptional regulator YhcF (GntR family)